MKKDMLETEHTDAPADDFENGLVQMPEVASAMEMGEEDSAGAGSGLDSSNTGLDSSNTSNEREDNAIAFGKTEHRNVIRSKILVFVVLLMATALVSFFTYFFMKQGETETFESKYQDFQAEIIENANKHAEEFLGTLLGLSNTITAFTLGLNSTWPEVTIPNFEILSSNAFEEAVGPELIIFAPIIQDSEQKAWEEYAVLNQGWIKNDLNLRGQVDVDVGEINEEVYAYNYDKESSMFVNFSLPLWQLSPAPTNAGIVMMDLYSQASFRRMVDDATLARHILLSEVVDRTFFWEDIDIYGSDIDHLDDPRSFAIQPVFDSFEDEANIVAFVFAVVPWETYFVNSLPYGIDGLVVRVEDTCGSNFAYLLNGPDAAYLGKDFQPESSYDFLSEKADFAAFARINERANGENEILHCAYTVSVHATSAYATSFETNMPMVLMVVVMTVFLFTAMVFVLYDWMVQQRQNKVMRAAQKTSAIVSSLFPKSVQKRILASALEEDDSKKRNRLSASGKDKLRNYFDGGDETAESKQGKGFDKPIADFFPDTTIMFGDIVGFTAWSSTREPSQVFTLLETIYNEFDRVAKIRKVFKVETVGDCYVAVCGLPDPRKDHAVIMARFARDCLSSLQRMTKELEVTLGPDTAELTMRIGLHSGPVTAGVLRGERARFQLFGDTMNTASRMESTGLPNRVHVSKEFVCCIEEAGKSHWISQREDKIFVKGKGYLQTFFLDFKSDNHVHQSDVMSSSGCDTNSNLGNGQPTDPQTKGEISRIAFQYSEKNDSKIARLVDWNVDLLTNILKEIVASRHSMGAPSNLKKNNFGLEELTITRNAANTISEVQEIIELPAYCMQKEVDPKSISLDPKVVQQLKTYITQVAHLYQQNPFHNFEHASHVTMSAVKLLSRVIAPDVKELGNNSNAQNLHDHTYGITSDPLTRFAVIISALIHDIDHPGVPNAQLIKEGDPMAKQYNNKSIAEQNSVDLAWELLHEPAYKDLRHCIYQTETELTRFRQLIVNSVLATDIMDKDLKALRNQKWDKAFTDHGTQDSARDSINRKATIVIEHLIQASDVAHTMQHWHIYCKWNARLFEEMYKAYVEGRAEQDPSTFWYKGEIGFLDFYVIPLAKKLKECGVFGVSSDEYLQYAMNNRDEWERKGEAIVKNLVQKVTSNPNYQRPMNEGDEKALQALKAKLVELNA